MSKKIQSMALALLMFVGMFTAIAQPAAAALGDGAFIVDDIEYMVLSESGITGTVQVGTDDPYTPAYSDKKTLTIPETVQYRGKSYLHD